MERLGLGNADELAAACDQWRQDRAEQLAAELRAQAIASTAR